MTDRSKTWILNLAVPSSDRAKYAMTHSETTSGTAAMPSREAWARAEALAEQFDGNPRFRRRPLDHAFLDRSLLASLALHAAQNPDRPCLVTRDRTTTYADLLDLVGRIGRMITTAKPPPGPIGILLADGAAYAACLFAGLMAGRPILPLDPTSAAERNAWLIDEAGATIVLTDGQAPESTITSGVRVVRLDDPWSLPPADPETITSLLGNDEPAFILATSGSSGRPKLLVHSQRSLGHRANQGGATMDLVPDDRFLFCGGSFASYSKIIYFLAQIRVGSSAHLIDIRTEGVRGLLQRMQDERITVIWAGASLIRMVADVAGAQEALACIRLIRLGGEPPARSDLALLTAVLPPGCPILNAYGSTETISFAWETSVDDDLDPVRVPAGAPHTGGDVLLIDEDGGVCAPGAVGELVIRSRYAALGEWQEGRCVPGRLRPDPNCPSARVYFTGDLARQTDDGVIIILGRKDRMVKVNGVRVEPAEVEEAILTSGHIVDATVLPRQTATSTLLVAFAVARPDAPTDLATRLRDDLRQRLPAVMVPARIVLVDVMPRLPSGKVDAQALLSRLSR